MVITRWEPLREIECWEPLQEMPQQQLFRQLGALPKDYQEVLYYTIKKTWFLEPSTPTEYPKTPGGQWYQVQWLAHLTIALVVLQPTHSKGLTSAIITLFFGARTLTGQSNRAISNQ